MKLFMQKTETKIIFGLFLYHAIHYRDGSTLIRVAHITTLSSTIERDIRSKKVILQCECTTDSADIFREGHKMRRRLRKLCAGRGEI